MKKILLTISLLLVFGTTFSQPKSLWATDNSVSPSVIKDFGDGSRAVVAFTKTGYCNIALFDVTTSTFPTLSTSVKLDIKHYISNIAVSNEEVFFCGRDSGVEQGIIGHTNESDIAAGDYSILTISEVDEFVDLVAYQDPILTNIFHVIAYGYDHTNQKTYIVEATYDKILSTFSTGYNFYSQNILDIWSLNILTTKDYFVFLYRDFYNYSNEVYIARCSKSNPLSAINIYRITGPDLYWMQNISGTHMDNNNIALSYYTFRDIYMHQMDVHFVDVSTMNNYNSQAFPLVEKCPPPQMTYITNDKSLVLMLYDVYPENPTPPTNVLSGYPTFVYLDVTQNSLYSSYWRFTDHYYRFNTLTSFSSQWFMGAAFGDIWYLEEKNDPTINSSCFEYSDVKVEIPNNILLNFYSTEYKTLSYGMLQSFTASDSIDIDKICHEP